MAENTKIEWCDHTVNFWWGCEKVSPACAHCYAERQDAHFHPSPPWRERFQDEKATASHWGQGAPRLLRVESAALEAMRYERQAEREGRRSRVFTNSMSDFFEDRRDLNFPRLLALDAIRCTPNLDWMILTKRPERIMDLLRRAEAEAPGSGLSDWLRAWIGWKAPANVWLGATVEDQERADQRVPALLQVPAAVRFLSCEPLLGPVDLSGEYLADLCGSYPFPHLEDRFRTKRINRLDWIIAGGESGPRARPTHPDWFRGLRDQCAAAGVPFFFKQWGEWHPMNQGDIKRPSQCVVGSFPDDPHTFVAKVGKKAAGRLLDGVLHDAYPEVVRG